MTKEKYIEEKMKEREYCLEKLNTRKEFLSSKENKTHPHYEIIYNQAYALEGYLHYLTMELELLSPTFSFINNFKD